MATRLDTMFDAFSLESDLGAGGDDAEFQVQTVGERMGVPTDTTISSGASNLAAPAASLLEAPSIEDHSERRFSVYCLAIPVPLVCELLRPPQETAISLESNAASLAEII